MSLLKIASVACIALTLGACQSPAKITTLSPRGDRLVRLIQRTGNDNMMAPEAPALMGITNEGRDIPVFNSCQDAVAATGADVSVAMAGGAPMVVQPVVGDAEQPGAETGTARIERACAPP